MRKRSCHRDFPISNEGVDVREGADVDHVVPTAGVRDRVAAAEDEQHVVAQIAVEHVGTVAAVGRVVALAATDVPVLACESGVRRQVRSIRQGKYISRGVPNGQTVIL